MIEIILVRHGRTQFNLEDRIQGHLDISLDAMGHTQAHTLANVIAPSSVAAVYSSDLQRAHDTAMYLARRAKLPVQTERGLRERHYGVFQGMLRSEAKKSFPRAYAALEGNDPNYRPPGGGETLLEFSSRVLNALRGISLREFGKQQGRADGRVVVVTHEGVLDMVYGEVRGLQVHEPRTRTHRNGSINKVYLMGTGFVSAIWDW